MKRITFARLAVLMLAVAGLALQGCGGDDNGSGISQDMYDALNAEKTASDAAAAAAMAAQAEAEAAAAAAMAAQMEAEADAAAAMAAQMEAEADAAAAMAAQATAEMNATAAIAAQAVAEAEAMAAKADLTEAEADLEAAEMALAAANEAKTMAETAKAIAESRIADAEMAQADAEAAQKEAEDAAEMYKQAAATAETAKMAAEAERDKYKMMYEEATDVPSVGTQVGAEGRAVARRIQFYLKSATSDSATTEAMPATIGQPVSVDKLMRDDDGLSFNLMEGTVTRLKHSDTADEAAPELDDLMGVALEKTGGGVMQEAVLYSDIEKSVTPFSSKYPYNVAIDGTSTAGVINTHHYVLALDTTDQLISGGNSVDDRISVTTGLSSDIPSRMLDIDATTATPMTLRGTYDGVPGQFVCAGAAGATCTLTWTANGITIAGDAATTDLLFKADNIETLIPDPDHLTFGVWMLAPDGPAAGGDIATFAMANAGTIGQMYLKALKGSATYKGSATGYYATRAAGSVEPDWGRFTATATLKANFDEPHQDLPDAATGTPRSTAEMFDPVALTRTRSVDSTVGGTNATTTYFRPEVAASGVSFKGSKIDEFMDKDGNMMEGWVVNLDGGALRRPKDVKVGMTGGAVTDADRLTAFNAALTAAGEAGKFDGQTSGTGYAMQWSGVWEASFHGTNRATLPTGVIGQFQASAGVANPHFIEGAIDLSTDGGFAGVLGSFGARQEKE